MNAKVAKAIVEMFDPSEFNIDAIYDAGSNYIFAISRIGSTEPSLDPFYIINKRTLDITGFLPHLNLDMYKNAMKHPIKLKQV